MKMSKGNPFKMDLGNPLGGGSHTSTIHEAYVIYPSEEANFTSLAGEKKRKKIFSLPSNNSANGKLLQLSQ